MYAQSKLLDAKLGEWSHIRPVCWVWPILLPRFCGFESLGLVKLAVGIWGFAFRPGFDICTYPGNGFIIADANLPLTIIILMMNGYGVLRTSYKDMSYVTNNYLHWWFSTSTSNINPKNVPRRVSQSGPRNGCWLRLSLLHTCDGDILLDPIVYRICYPRFPFGPQLVRYSR